MEDVNSAGPRKVSAPEQTHAGAFSENVENSVTLLLGAEPIVKILPNKNDKKWSFFLLCLSVGENR